MQTAATTSHAALTASPRLSATIANATAPRRATAIHKSFVCGAPELLTILMDVLPELQEPNQTRVTLAGTLIEVDRGKSGLAGIVPFRTQQGQDWVYTAVRTHNCFA